MDLIILYFWGSCHHRVRVWQIVEGTLLSEHFSSVQVSEDKVFLFSLITDYWFDKDVGQLLNWVNDFANASQDEKDVISLVLDLLQAVALAHALFLKVDLEVLDESPGQAPQFRDVSDEKFYFLLTGRQLSFGHNVDVGLAVEFNDFASAFRSDSGVVSPWLGGITFEAEVSAVVNCLRVLELVWSFWLHDDFESARYYKIEPLTYISLLVQKIPFL